MGNFIDGELSAHAAFYVGSLKKIQFFKVWGVCRAFDFIFSS